MLSTHHHIDFLEKILINPALSLDFIALLKFLLEFSCDLSVGYILAFLPEVT